MKCDSTRKRFFGSIALVCWIAAQTGEAHSKGAGTCLAHARMMEKMSPANASANRVPPIFIQPSNGLYPGVQSPSNFESHIISLVGPRSIRGFLLYAEDCFGRRVGRFTADTLRGTGGISREHFLEPCRGPTTITHTNNRDKSGPELDFKWSAPDQDVGPITFYAAVVMSFKEWYILDPVTISTPSRPGQICDWMVPGSQIPPPDRSAMEGSGNDRGGSFGGGGGLFGSGGRVSARPSQMSDDGHQDFDQNFVFSGRK
jgi:uncharacterized membrane protein YgcG